MELQEARLKIHQYIYENTELTNDELKEIRATIIKGEKSQINKSNISYYYFGVHYPEGYIELLDSLGKPLRNNSQKELIKRINEGRIASMGRPLYLIKETTEAERI